MITQSDMQGTHIRKSRPLDLYKVRTAGLVVWCAVVILQLLWGFEARDLFSTALTLLGGVIGILVFLRADFLITYPISTMMMLGYVSYYFLLPPLATILEGKPLTNNLDHPEWVHWHAFLCLITLIAVYTIYRYMQPLRALRQLVSIKIYRPLGLFCPPSRPHLLIMGGLGLTAMGVQTFLVGVYQGNAVGVVNKLMQGFYPLAYLPYVILVGKLIGRNEPPGRKWLVILAVYSLFLGIVSLGGNSRTALFVGFASIILAYFYGLAVGIYKASSRAVRMIVLVAFALVLISGQLANLGLSMLVVRGKRANISAIVLVSETLKVFQDKSLLKYSRTNTSPTGGGWDEVYVDNLFFARLSNLKYADISIDLALSMNAVTRDYIRRIETQRILAYFPRPLISLLELPVDKNLVGAASSGDFMFYAVTGYEYALGGFRTGSIFGNGLALFGWWYPIVFAGLILLVCPFADALTTKINALQYGKTSYLILSAMAIVGFYNWFFFLTSAANGSESFSDLAGYLIRGWIQVLFIYALAYWGTYPLLRLFGRKRP